MLNVISKAVHCLELKVSSGTKQIDDCYIKVIAVE